MNQPVLCVDLDNTLVHTDVLMDFWWRLLITKPWKACYALWVYLFSGMTACKGYLNTLEWNYAHLLPYNHQLIQWLLKQRETKKVWLVTGCTHSIALKINEHLQLFHGVQGSHAQSSMVANHKKRWIKSKFKTFSYIGDSKQDLAVWPSAKQKGLVFKNINPFPHIQFDYLFKSEGLSTVGWIKLLYLHHWLVIWALLPLSIPINNSLTHLFKVMLLLLGISCFYSAFHLLQGLWLNLRRKKWLPYPYLLISNGTAIKKELLSISFLLALIGQTILFSQIFATQALIISLLVIWRSKPLQKPEYMKNLLALVLIFIMINH